MTDYIGLIVVGMCTGLGSALGNFLAQYSFIRHVEKIGKKKENGGNGNDWFLV